ncbi:MAG: glycogen synthase [Actinomycetales bacterium]|nr:glycogen synthase [Actinomycetales bacterium]
MSSKLSSDLRIGLVTKEWPPQVYGGAGVHVVQLSQALRNQPGIAVDVHCFGGPRTDAFGYDTPSGFENSNAALQALATDLAIADKLGGVDLIHSHTWYANFAGFTANLLHGTPHVVSAHSLEPLRPWKAEQLGGGYRISSWAEKSAYEAADAIIAVSDGMRADVLNAYPNVNPAKVVTIRNGVDVSKFAPNNKDAALKKHGIEGRYAIFVGRITRQKGLAHLLRAWKNVSPEYGLVLAAGSPDEPGIGKEVADLIAELQQTRKNVWWIKEMAPHDDLTSLLTHADLFLCPSIYEPLGIVNLEAMGCETAVLGSRVGGIPEVVAHNETGRLVDYDANNATKFENDFTTQIEELMSNQTLLIQLGKAGRVRAEKHFGWDAVAKQTIELYKSLLK